MDPSLILFAIRAAVRIGRSTEEAVGQYARDRETLLPLVREIKFPKEDQIRFLFSGSEELLRPPAVPYWKSFMHQGPRLAGDLDVLCAEYAFVQAQQQNDLKDRAQEATGYWIAAQWSDKDAPAGPLARIVLSLIDVAAQYAQLNPSLFGIGGKGEVLVKALAENIDALIPDNDQPLGPRNEFGERLATLFLKAGLAALQAHPEAVVEQEQWQSLIKSTLPKIIAQLPDTGLAGLPWRDAIEELLQPVAQGAIEAAAANPHAFFGKRFGNDQLLGALTQSFLVKAAARGPDKIFTKAGAIDLYKSVVGLAADRPDLFIGDANGKSDKFVTALFGDLASVLKTTAPPFDSEVVGKLAAVVLDTVGREARVLSDSDESWHTLLGQVLAPIVTALQTSVAAKNSDALRALVSGPALTEFARIILSQVAKTPGMVVSSDKPEVKSLVAALASAMAEDSQLLLSSDDWLKIVAVAAEEVAANPGRLLGLDSKDPTQELLYAVISKLLLTAAQDWRQGQRARTVLFGAALCEAIVVTIRAAASNAGSALNNVNALGQLATSITAFIAANPSKYGSKEWLRLFRKFIVQALHDGTVPQFDATLVDAALAGIIQ